jgi:hypothetical protein
MEIDMLEIDNSTIRMWLAWFLEAESKVLVRSIAMLKKVPPTSAKKEGGRRKTLSILSPNSVIFSLASARND